MADQDACISAVCKQAEASKPSKACQPEVGGLTKGQDACRCELLDALGNDGVLQGSLPRCWVALQVAKHIVDDRILQNLLDLRIFHGVCDGFLVPLPRIHALVHLLHALRAPRVARIQVQTLVEVSHRLCRLLEHDVAVASPLQRPHKLGVDFQSLVAVLLGRGPLHKLHVAQSPVAVQRVILGVPPDSLVVHRLGLDKLTILDEGVAFLLLRRRELRVDVGLCLVVPDSLLALLKLLLHLLGAVLHKRV
mmetsp:Transcript_3197/g.6319  ORF Transcript_3197/g.6319 Transcript_3197/m.6319 type:complete len:250 (-) Transcript_3197:1178-1927(-)